MKSSKPVHLALVALWFTIATPVRAQAIDSTRLISDLRVLSADSMEGRRTGTPGNARARAFIENAVKRIGLRPLKASLSAPFVAKSRAGADLHGVNIVSLLRGRMHPDRYIVISAHYDHLGVRKGGTSKGADGEAAGSGAGAGRGRWAASSCGRWTAWLTGWCRRRRGSGW